MFSMELKKIMDQLTVNTLELLMLVFLKVIYLFQQK